MYLPPRIGICLFFLFLILNVSLLVFIVFEMRFILLTMNEDVVDLQLLKFNNYLIQFNKTNTDREYYNRLQNFKASLVEIERLNALEGCTVFGLTEFADMSAQEFADRMLSKPVGRTCTEMTRSCPKPYEFNQHQSTTNNAASTAYLNDIDKKIDWREKGVIGPILNQRTGCLACWAFSIIGVMESMATIQNVTSFQSRSIQQLLDCSSDNEGCRGGNIHRALKFLCKNKMGIVGQEEYPLTLKEEVCQLPKPGHRIWVKSYAYRCKMNDEDLRRQIMKGPVVTIVDASSWQFYLGGIIWRACGRNDRSPNHDVQIVGYDTTGDIPYYIVKNSWGEQFGDHGYVKIAMHGRICGISDEVCGLEVQ